jgi:hypothetical protein
MSNSNEKFENYDDNNIEHVSNAPDYGQCDGVLKWEIKNFPIYYFNFTIPVLRYKIYNILYIS